MIPALAAIPALLLKVPFIGKIVGFIAPNARLMIEYALIAAILCIGGATVHLWSVKNEYSKKNAELTLRMGQAEALAAVHEAVIVSLNEARERDNAAIVRLASENKRLDEVGKTHRSQIAKLEKENANVRNYLAERIPPELACVLNRTCDKDGGEKRTPTTHRSAVEGM